jgi:uncharacterized damage-inducible protein DinB
MSDNNPVLKEFENEAATTARVLEAVPEEQLGWKPHQKSMTLGQLALHIAGTPAHAVEIVSGDSYEFTGGPAKQPAGRAEIMEAFTASVEKTKAYLSELTPERAAGLCRLSAGGREMGAAPRFVLIRRIMLNHWYHHRGQLTVYLRLLNVAVPSVYGPSADDNPFVKSARA